jgi:hypothetical protein
MMMWLVAAFLVVSAQAAAQGDVTATTPTKNTVAAWKEEFARAHLMREKHLAQHIQSLDKELLGDIEEVDSKYQAQRKQVLKKGGSQAKLFLATELQNIQKMRVVAERFEEQHEDLHEGIAAEYKDIGDRTAAIDEEEAEAKAAGGADSDHRLLARQKERIEIKEALTKLDQIKGKNKQMEDRVVALKTALTDAEANNKNPNDKTLGLADGFKKAHMLIRADLQEQEQQASDLEAITEEADEEEATSVQDIAGGLGLALSVIGVGMLAYAEFARRKPSGAARHDERSGLVGAGSTTKFGSEL